MVRQHTIVLLGHAAVVRTKPRFEVGEGVVELHRRHCARERGVGVAVNEHPVGSVLVEHGIQRREDAPCLDPVRARTHAQVNIWVRDAKVSEEDVRHERVVVLPRVHDDMFVAALRQRSRDGSEFDELRAGANDAEDLHDKTLSGDPTWTFDARFHHPRPEVEIRAQLRDE